MKSLRQFVYSLLKDDPGMNQLGLTEANLYAIYARQDTNFAVEGERFLILRWGPQSVGIGPSIPVDLAPWAYDISPEYSWIDDVLHRAKQLLEPLAATALNVDRTAWLTSIEWQGSGPDLFDDLYNRYTRSDSYRVVASGN